MQYDITLAMVSFAFYFKVEYHINRQGEKINKKNKLTLTNKTIKEKEMTEELEEKKSSAK